MEYERKKVWKKWHIIESSTSPNYKLKGKKERKAQSFSNDLKFHELSKFNKKWNIAVIIIIQIFKIYLENYSRTDLPQIQKKQTKVSVNFTHSLSQLTPFIEYLILTPFFNIQIKTQQTDYGILEKITPVPTLILLLPNHVQPLHSFFSQTPTQNK